MAVEIWGIRKENIIGIVFDTTPSNTGEWSGVCSLLSDWIGHNVIWCGCRKHMIELWMTWFCKAVCGETKDPGQALFRKFKKEFLSFDITLGSLIRLDLSQRPDWVKKKLAQETKEWAISVLAKGILPRDNYH